MPGLVNPVQPQRPGALIKQEQTAISPWMRSLLKKREALEPARQAVKDTREQAIDVKFQADNAYLLGLEKHTGSVERAAIRGDEALDRLDTIDRMPNFMGRLLGILDSDFNEDIQERNLTRAQLDISRSVTGLQTIQNRRALLINSAQFEREAAKEEFEFDRRDMLDVVALKEAGIAIERNIRRQTVEFAQDRSVIELKEFLADMSTAPVELQGKPGLIKLIIDKRRAAKANLSLAEFNVSTLKRLEDKKTFLDQFKSVEELKAFNGKLPPEVSELDMLQREEQFVSVGINIETMKLAFAAKKTELFEASLTRMFNDLDSGTVAQMSQKAKKSSDGKFDMGDGVKISATRLQTELVAIKKREKERATAMEENSIALAGVQSAIIADDLINAQLPGLYNPTDPNADESTMPPQVLAWLAARNDRVINQKARIAQAIQNGDPTVGAMTSVLVDLLDEKADYFKERVEERVENDFNPKSRRGAREYFLTGNTSPPNATQLLVDVIGNASIFVDNDILNNAWKKLTEEAADTFVDKFANIDPSGGGLTITSGKPKDSIALEKVVKDSGFRALVAQNVQIMTMAMAAHQLVQEFSVPQPPTAQEARLSPRVETKVSKAFSSIRDPRTGLLAKKYYNDDGAFDMGDFLEDTAKMSDALQLTGDLPINVNIADMVFERARLGVDKTLENAFRGLYGNSVENAIFGGRAINSEIKALLDTDASIVPQSVRTAQDNRISRDKVLEFMEEQAAATP